MSKLFVSPHNDDAALFGAFMLQQERPRPLVLTVFDSVIQVERGFKECGAPARRQEDLWAMTLLECTFHSGYVPDNLPAEAAREAVRNVLASWYPSAEVWLPAIEPGGHEQHNLIGEIGREVFAGAKIHSYLTYTRTGGKSTNGREVKPTGAMVLRKLQALSCYRTQIEIDALGCWPHFMDLREFEANEQIYDLSQ